MSEVAQDKIHVSFGGMLDIGKLHKVFSISFEKFGRGVNRVVTEREWKWSATKFWGIFGEISNV